MSLAFRTATLEDIPAIVRMLADDPLGAKRERFETPLPDSYLEAFAAIDQDPNNELIVAVFNNEMAGFLQLTFIPYLTYQGRWRALVEGIRVNRKFRNQGIGKQMLQQAIDRAQAKQCHLIQLTTDKKRPDALKFYQSLGFQATHEGMKLHFNS